MLLDCIRKCAVYALAGVGFIGGPIIIPQTSQVYAQEQKEEPKKEQTLEDKLTETIQRLEAIEKKIPTNYTRLVDLYYHFRFDKEKIITLINEAVCNIEKEQSEYQYLEAIRLFLSDKKSQANAIKETLIKNPNAKARLKSNLVLILDQDHLSAYHLDKTNIRTHTHLFSNDNIKEMKSEYISKLDFIEDIEKICKKYKTRYNTAIACAEEFPEKTFYLIEINRSFAEIMKIAFRKAIETKNRKEGLAIVSSKEIFAALKKFADEAEKAYQQIIRFDPSSYQTHIEMGLFIRQEKEIVISMSGKGFAYTGDESTELALPYFDKAYRILKQKYEQANDNKDTLKEKLAEAAYEKGKCLHHLMAGIKNPAPRQFTKYFYEDKAKEALALLQESVRLSPENNYSTERKDMIKDIIGRLEEKKK